MALREGGPGSLVPVSEAKRSLARRLGVDPIRISQFILDLSVARTEERVELPGRFFAVLETTSPTARAFITLGQRGGPAIPVRQGFQIEGIEFDEIFVTNVAQVAGTTMTIISTMADVDFASGIFQVENAIGTGRVEDSNENVSAASSLNIAADPNRIGVLIECVGSDSSASLPTGLDGGRVFIFFNGSVGKHVLFPGDWMFRPGGESIEYQNPSTSRVVNTKTQRWLKV